MEKEESRIARLLKSTGSIPDMNKIKTYVDGGGRWADLYQDDAARNKLAESALGGKSTNGHYPKKEWATLLDDIAKNCNPEDIKKVIPNFMKRHKHSSRLNKLYQRIAMWKQVGPSVSEAEWDVMIAALRMVEVLMNKCSVDVDYKITAQELKQLNHYYRLYKIGK